MVWVPTPGKHKDVLTAKTGYLPFWILLIIVPKLFIVGYPSIFSKLQSCVNWISPDGYTNVNFRLCPANHISSGVRNVAQIQLINSSCMYKVIHVCVEVNIWYVQPYIQVMLLNQYSDGNLCYTMQHMCFSAALLVYSFVPKLFLQPNTDAVPFSSSFIFPVLCACLDIHNVCMFCFLLGITQRESCTTPLSDIVNKLLVLLNVCLLGPSPMIMCCCASILWLWSFSSVQ